MLIVSWNVAGLSTTVNRIHEHYGSLQTFVERHQADILCMQEHKISRSCLSSRTEPQKCSMIPGYESFWSCCIDPKQKGLNGVVTYVRTGCVVAADAAPLGDPELDHQGRCIATDHGNFVLYNVYVPNTGGQGLTYKMRFLNALRRSILKQRVQNGKRVILVGDLNVTHTALDVHWKNRVILVNQIIDEVMQGTAADCKTLQLPRWKLDLVTHWGTIRNVLDTQTVQQTQTTNSLTNTKYDRFRLSVSVNGKRVFLGSHEVSPEYCQLDFSARTYYDADENMELPCSTENAVPVDILAELLQKIVGVCWNEELQKQISEEAGTVDPLYPPRQWLNHLLQQDQFVDVFRHLHGNAQSRFTCWNQNKNKRYTNEGSRIDYVLVDPALMELVEIGSPLRCHPSGNENKDCCITDFKDSQAALSAVTAGGQYQPASFVGGGITEAPRHVLDTQFGALHTGHIYTPPTYSDHIGVSVLFRDAIFSNGHGHVLAVKDAVTRRAQPHKQQASIVSFFKPETAGTAKSSNEKNRQPASTKENNTCAERKSKKPKIPNNSVWHHFQKQS